MTVKIQYDQTCPNMIFCALNLPSSSIIVGCSLIVDVGRSHASSSGWWSLLYFLDVSCGQFHNHPFPQVSFPTQKNIIIFIPNFIPIYNSNKKEQNPECSFNLSEVPKCFIGLLRRRPRITRPPSARPLRCVVFDHKKWHLRRSRKQSHNPQGKLQGPHHAVKPPATHTTPILLMVHAPVHIGSLPYYLQGFMNLRWLFGIS